MTRVIRRAGSVRHGPDRATQRRARRHKVIMESVTQEKKKLRSVICFEAQAPSGYTFIPAGNPQLTTTCKERCRDEGLQIYAVSTTPHHRHHNLSQHVHRIGYHFPSTVVAAVCSELGFYLTSTGKTVPSTFPIQKLENNIRGESEISQQTLNTEARDALKDLFPNMPEKDLNQIIKTAFQKGQKKVGTATELPLARRAQLAVVAHVRHVYTDYDRLLKTTSFHEARGVVEHTTLAKVIEWRGDDENGQTVLEDVFREVIVISDDEDSESEEDAVASAGHQDTSVEILASDTRAHEIRCQPMDNTNSLGQDLPRELSEEAPPGFRFVTRAPATDTINRRGFNRYKAWTRAVKEYREGIQGTEEPRFSGAPAEKQSPRYAEQRITKEVPAARRQDIVPQHAEVHRRVAPGSASNDNQAHPVLAIPLMDRQRHVGIQENYLHSDVQQNYSTYDMNARPTGLTNKESPELQILEELSGPRNVIMSHSQDVPPSRMEPIFRQERLPPQSDRTNAPVFVSGPKENRQKLTPVGRYPDSVNTPLLRPGSNTQDSILPSIENPRPIESRWTDASHPLVHMTNKMSLRSVTPGYSQGEMGHHPDAIEKEGDSEHASKRRRLTCRERSRTESRPDPWSARPMGLPVSEGFAPHPYRRLELVQDHRPKELPHFRRDYLPVEQPPVVGYQRERNQNSLSYSNAQYGLETRSVLGRQHISGPYEPKAQAGLSSTSIVVSEGDRTFRAAPAVSNSGPWHPYHGDRSFRSDRAPKEPRAMRHTRIDSGRPLSENVHTDRNLYAEDFVRHVDHREPPPLEYVSRRAGPEATPIGEPSQSTRIRDFDYLGTKNLSQVSSDQRGSLPKGPRVTPSHDHLRTFSDSIIGKLQPHVSPHERPASGGFNSLRPSSNYPSSSQTTEQDRPVYVQRVEPRPPYPLPDGRHFVIVDY
ncbi:hypothetical protein DTO006G1_6254 [Penicillium roqueforti]|uniref:DUF2293 domain-containing protein n=1 Tax=Penicillium roqueforti (strain FM164) TaxID=1365484 RepID=W6Q149_PENRF|nr:hypothetical protein LCP963914a_7928 [Penicillium roqueforti]CDM30040.1 Domain of unknown function DUF2293 [Penicillium roqueforti FM164]KAI2718411.1 hypothetical protein CBS147354_6426 [Penicillium roqueforti]KAI2758857.1 hypothetical protein DTO006G1_6254 [Penicillium roqueforti]KAI3071175.1 hypothetical protein CBS147339_7144 [Penicillium roqueforti]